jgi:phage terminase large subunit GpA-like protein
MFEFRSAALVIAETIAETLRPPEPMAPSEWAAANLFVPDGPQAGEPFDLALTPYLVEPLNLLGPDSPVNEIAVMKSSQTGFSTMIIAIVGYFIDRAPCRALLIQPTSDAASDFNRAKLDQAITGSPALRRKVALQVAVERRLDNIFEIFPGRVAHVGDREFGRRPPIQDGRSFAARRD